MPSYVAPDPVSVGSCALGLPNAQSRGCRPTPSDRRGHTECSPPAEPLAANRAQFLPSGLNQPEPSFRGLSSALNHCVIGFVAASEDSLLAIFTGSSGNSFRRKPYSNLSVDFLRNG